MRKSGIVAAVVVVACGAEPAESDPDWSDPARIAFAEELAIDLDAMTKTSSGLYYRDVVVGSGETAQPGDTAVVHFTGFLPDGRSFDSTRRGQPRTFPLGAGRVIPGWEEGVTGMKVGGTRRLVLPPSVAYGERGGAGGTVPPNATLIFDVELLELR